MLVLAGLHFKGVQFITTTIFCAYGMQHVDLLHNEYCYHLDNII